MHDLCFLCTVCKSDVVAISSKAASALLHDDFNGSVKRRVICEQETTHCSLLDLSLYLKLTQVEGFTISSAAYANTVSIVIAERIRQHGCEQYPKKSWGKDTALLNTIGDRECFIRVSLGRACHRGINATL